MKLNRIMLFVVLCLPLSLWAPEEFENTAPVDHTKELNDQEKQTFNEILKEKAKKHYKDGYLTGLRTSNYISRTEAIQDNDIKRYLIDLHSDPTSLSEKLAQLSKERLTDLQRRLNARTKEEKEENWKSSKGLRKDLEALSNLIEILTEEPQSLDEAYKKLDFIQTKLSEYKNIRNKIALINKELEQNSQNKSLLSEKNTLEQSLKKGARLEQLSSTLEEKLKKYINSKPIIERLVYKKQKLAELIKASPKLQKLNTDYPTTQEQLNPIKKQRSDIFENDTDAEILELEVTNIKTNRIPKLQESQKRLNLKNEIDLKKYLDLEKEIEVLNLKLEIYNLEQMDIKEQKEENRKKENEKEASLKKNNNDDIPTAYDDVIFLLKQKLEKKYSNADEKALNEAIQKADKELQNKKITLSTMETLELVDTKKWLLDKIKGLKK